MNTLLHGNEEKGNNKKPQTPISNPSKSAEFLKETIFAAPRWQGILASIIRGALFPVILVTYIPIITFSILIVIILWLSRNFRAAGSGNSMDDQAFASLVALPVAALIATYGSAQGYYLLSISHTALNSDSNKVSSYGLYFIAGSILFSGEFTFLAIRGVMKASSGLSVNPFSPSVDPQKAMQALEASPKTKLLFCPNRAELMRKKILKIGLEANSGRVYLKENKQNPPPLIWGIGKCTGLFSKYGAVEIISGVVVIILIKFAINIPPSLHSLGDWRVLFSEFLVFLLLEPLSNSLTTALLSNDVLRRYYRYVAMEEQHLIAMEERRLVAIEEELNSNKTRSFKNLWCRI